MVSTSDPKLWIPDSTLVDSGFLELGFGFHANYFGSQALDSRFYLSGFRIPRPEFRILKTGIPYPQANIFLDFGLNEHLIFSWILESVLSYMFLCTGLRFPSEQQNNLPWLDILENVYASTRKTTSSIRQGGPAGPTLFILTIDMCIRDFLEKVKSSHAMLKEARDRRNVP